MPKPSGLANREKTRRRSAIMPAMCRTEKASMPARCPASVRGQPMRPGCSLAVQANTSGVSASTVTTLVASSTASGQSGTAAPLRPASIQKEVAPTAAKAASMAA